MKSSDARTGAKSRFHEEAGTYSHQGWRLLRLPSHSWPKWPESDVLPSMALFPPGLKLHGTYLMPGGNTHAQISLLVIGSLKTDF